MEYLDKLLEQTDYLENLKKLEQLENKRIYCRHGLSHLLDVARIAWIRNLEHGYMLDREQIYLAALLHDIGRIREYEDGVPHQAAGADLAGRLLAQIEYPREKGAILIRALEKHRGGQRDMEAGGEAGRLMAVLRWADKKSRCCFFCEARHTCKWPFEQRNQNIEI